MSGNGELSATDLPSDVKSIAYYLRNESSAESFADNPNAPGGEASTDGFGRGLMRAEMDRAVTSYADSGGGTASIYSTAQLLADEVVGLGFEYFDGTEWPTEWDSSTQGLPRAIRVWLSIKPRYGMSEKEIAQANEKEARDRNERLAARVERAPLVVAARRGKRVGEEAESDAKSGRARIAEERDERGRGVGPLVILRHRPRLVERDEHVDG